MKNCVSGVRKMWEFIRQGGSNERHFWVALWNVDPMFMELDPYYSTLKSRYHGLCCISLQPKGNAIQDNWIAPMKIIFATSGVMTEFLPLRDDLQDTSGSRVKDWPAAPSPVQIATAASVSAHSKLLPQVHKCILPAAQYYKEHNLFLWCTVIFFKVP